MKKYLPSGAEMDIIPNETGGFDVTVIGPNRTFNSLGEADSAIYSDTLEVYRMLLEQGLLVLSPPEDEKTTKDIGIKTKKGKSTKPTETPASNLQPVKGLDGQTMWVRPSAPQTPPENDEYSWDAPAPQEPPAPPPVTTYGAKPPTSDEPSEKIRSSQNTSYQFAANLIFPQSSTHVAQGFHPEMVKPGEALSDFQIAYTVFPENNKSVVVSVGVHLGNKGIDPVNIDADLNISVETRNPNIEEISKKEIDIDLGLFELKNTVTERNFYEEVNLYNPDTGQVQKEKTVRVSFVREEKSYKSIEIEGGGGLEEERNVYVNDKLTISQYRLGMIVGKDTKDINLSKNVGLGGGFEVKFDSPWIDNPIPKQEEEKQPSIDIYRDEY